MGNVHGRDRGPRRQRGRAPPPRRSDRGRIRGAEGADRVDEGPPREGAGRRGGRAPAPRPLTLLDAYAVVALLVAEPAGAEVKELLRAGGCRVVVVNLAEAI